MARCSRDLDLGLRLLAHAVGKERDTVDGTHMQRLLPRPQTAARAPGPLASSLARCT